MCKHIKKKAKQMEIHKCGYMQAFHIMGLNQWFSIFFLLDSLVAVGQKPCISKSAILFRKWKKKTNLKKKKETPHYQS